MRTLTVMAEHCINTSDEDNNIPVWEGHTLVDGLDISNKLHRLLDKWNALYEFGPDDVTSQQVFVTLGRSAAVLLKEELNSQGTEILYYNELTQEREVI